MVAGHLDLSARVITTGQAAELAEPEGQSIDGFWNVVIDAIGATVLGDVSCLISDREGFALVAGGIRGMVLSEPWQDPVLKLTHIGVGLGLIIAWVLLVAGFLKYNSANGSTDVSAG